MIVADHSMIFIKKVMTFVMKNARKWYGLIYFLLTFCEFEKKIDGVLKWEEWII